MFFFVSKVLWSVFKPANLFLLALCLGAVLLLTRWRRLGAGIVLATALAALVIAATPLPRIMLIALEDRFPVPRALPDTVDGIVVLAGMVDLLTSEGRERTAFNGRIERIIVGAELAERYPEARLVFTGGSGLLGRQDLLETTFVRPFVDQLGVGGDRIAYESRSRTTFENATQTVALVDPEPDETWVLVTSALHMPRAMGCFRQVGWTVIPYPVDHLTNGSALWWPPPFDLARGLSDLNAASREWVGLVAYWITGRSDALFPGPDS